MALLAIETFQVCLGVDENDPTPVIFARGVKTLDIARQIRDEHTRLVVAGAYDETVVAGKVFFVRVTPGVQSAAVGAQTPSAVLAVLRTRVVAVPVYVATADDAGQNISYVRIGTVGSDRLMGLTS